jgi:hypothetical protein
MHDNILTVEIWKQILVTMLLATTAGGCVTTMVVKVPHTTPCQIPLFNSLQAAANKYTYLHAQSFVLISLSASSSDCSARTWKQYRW